MENLAMGIANPKQLSPLTLAFVGDGVYELLVRERLTRSGSLPPNKLHRRSVELVKASAQAAAYERLEGELSEEELSVMKRGRNSSTANTPKHADVVDYRKATGIEALFGYLYLKGEVTRINELFELILRDMDADYVQNTL